MIALRSLAFAVWFFGMSFVLALATIPLRLCAPLLRPDWPMRFGRMWVGLVQGGMRRLCGITVRVTGLEHVPTHGPALLAAMHQSAFDTMVWLPLLPAPAYVFKRELLAIPLFGAMLKLTGMIPLDRRARAAAVRAFLHGASAAAATGRQIIIFPEGTRVAPGVRAPLLPGVAVLAARTGLPVIPVATDSGRCWGRRAWLKRPGVMHFAILPPLPAGLPREELLARLRAAWDEGCRLFAANPVDISVHEPSAPLPSEAR